MGRREGRDTDIILSLCLSLCPWMLSDLRWRHHGPPAHPRVSQVPLHAQAPNPCPSLSLTPTPNPSVCAVASLSKCTPSRSPAPSHAPLPPWTHLLSHGHGLLMALVLPLLPLHPALCLAFTTSLVTQNPSMTSLFQNQV